LPLNNWLAEYTNHEGGTKITNKRRMQVGGWGRLVCNDINNANSARKREYLKKKKMRSRDPLEAPKDVKQFLL
jgi:hypothetical protein